MKPILHTYGVWSRLTKLAGQGTACCAVPYFATGASQLLPLKPGSKLVVKFDRASVESGQVNPKEVVHLINGDVEVHACANLHAKVFVIGNTTIIGSANVSGLSANHLVEACVEIRSRAFAESCRKFIQSISGDVVGLEFAKRMIKFYRPPRMVPSQTFRRGKIGRVVPEHSGLWLVSLVESDWDDIDRGQEDAGWATAERALSNPKKSRIETFLWEGGRLLTQLKRDERILMNTKTETKRVLVSPPGRVLDIRKYRSGSRSKGIVYLEVPSDKRRRDLGAFMRSLGRAGKLLGNPRRTKRLCKPELIYMLGKLFA
jgi:hypothetical protein